MLFCPTVCEFITENRKVNLKNQEKGTNMGAIRISVSDSDLMITRLQGEALFLPEISNLEVI